MNTPKYRRILLKISGEILAGEQGYGIHPAVLDNLADEIGSVVSLGVEVAVVIGGGNIFRGIAASENGMERASADCPRENIAFESARCAAIGCSAPSMRQSSRRPSATETGAVLSAISRAIA